MSLSVLMAVDFPFPGSTGSPLHCMTIASGLREAGCRVVVVKYEGKNKEHVERDRWEGIDIHRIPRCRWLSTVSDIVADHRPDVIYAHGLLSAFVASPAVFRRRIPLVVEVHASSPGFASGLLARGRHGLLGLWPRLCRAEVIALSFRDADVLQGRHVVKPGKSTVAYPPVDLDQYLQAPRGIRRDRPVVLYVGNFMPYQGLDLLVGAIPGVLAARPDVRFRIVGGSDADNQEAMAQLADDERAAVELLGRVDPTETPGLYEDVDILVIPRPDLPINTTTARKLGEYLAAGRVVVATDVGDHRRLLEPAGAGIVCDADRASLQKALIGVLNDTGGSLRMAQAAQRVARRHFSLNTGLKSRLEVLGRAAGATIHSAESSS